MTQQPAMKSKNPGGPVAFVIFSVSSRAAVRYFYFTNPSQGGGRFLGFRAVEQQELHELPRVHRY